MPKADATGLAPEESADYNPPAHDSSVREGLASASTPRCFYFQELHHISHRAQRKSSLFLWWSLWAEALGLKRAKIARPSSPGAPNPAFLTLLRLGYRSCLHKASILSHSRAPSTPSAGQTEKESENAIGK